MRALRFSEFGPVSNLALAEVADPQPTPGMAVVRVAAASINPSDVNNVQGRMEHVSLPRVPGRDYAGVVVHGPAEWLGAEVWGTGGEIGYTIDGTHADLIAVPAASLRRKPAALTMFQAASIGVTYLAAWLGVVEYAALAAGETLLVIGVGGGVGGAAAQVGRARGARVLGVDRHSLPPGSPVSQALDAFHVLEDSGLAPFVEERTQGRGAHLVFDAVGGPMFAPALAALAPRGRLVEISSAGGRQVSFDLVDFYHNESRLFGVDTRKRDAAASANLLEQIAPGFESGIYAAPGIDEVVKLADAREAYAKMAAGGARGRLVIEP